MPPLGAASAFYGTKLRDTAAYVIDCWHHARFPPSGFAFMTAPVSSLAFVFPGQGSQSVGMLAELAELHPEVEATFDEASDGAGVDLWALSQQGPEQQLNRTEYTQPALLAASVAVWRLWRAQGGAVPAQLAGHSLGEYSALVAAEAIALRDAAHWCASAARRCRRRHRRVRVRWPPCSARRMRWSRRPVATFRACTWWSPPTSIRRARW
jgi:acyl transferase domain-containing protein